MCDFGFDPDRAASVLLVLVSDFGIGEMSALFAITWSVSGAVRGSRIFSTAFAAPWRRRHA